MNNFTNAIYFSNYQRLKETDSADFLFCSLLFFYSCTCCIWKFLGQGLKWRYSCWPRPQQQQRQIQALSTTYTTASGNARCLTHSARQGLKLHPHGYQSGLLPLSHTMGTPQLTFYTKKKKKKKPLQNKKKGPKLKTKEVI